MTDEKKTLKFQMMMSPSEAKLLDDWMFDNRIRSRAEAIRRLWRVGLLFDAKAAEITRLRSQLMDGATGLLSALADSKNAKDTADFLRPSADVIASTAFLQLQVGLVTRYLHSLKEDLPFDDAEDQAKEEIAIIEKAIADMKEGKKVRLDVDAAGAVIRLDDETE